MALDKLFALIRADVRRPWRLWTCIFLVGSFVLLGAEELCSYRLPLARQRFADSVCLCGSIPLLGFFVGAVLSLLRRDVARVVPSLLLLLLISLGLQQLLMGVALLFLVLMWLLYVVLSIASRLLGR
jgi:hypothetical protein